MYRLRRASLTLSLLAFMLPAQATWVSPFISEIHYDNVGGDVNELIAVTGPLGVDLSGWRLVLYNGANGQPYDTVALAGPRGGFGDTWVEYYWPVAGLQNGPDAVALVSPDDRLIDFVAYEAAVQGSLGAAAGVVASQLPVSEGSTTPATHSLQRGGTADNWVWSLDPATPGQLNPGLSGFSTTAVPVTGVWQLWLTGFFAWLLLSAAGRERLTVAGVQRLKRVWSRCRTRGLVVA